jgi:hypothetical protein
MRHAIDCAGGLVQLDEIRNLDRRRSVWIGVEPGWRCAVIAHAGRSLGHCGGKRKTLPRI